MKEIILAVDWTQIIITIITVVIAPMLVLLLSEAKKWIATKTDNELTKRFTDLVLNAVSAANQEMVGQLKDAHLFDNAKALEVKEIVKMKFFSYLTIGGKKELDRLFKDVDNFIADVIEKQVGDKKILKAQDPLQVMNVIPEDYMV